MILKFLINVVRHFLTCSYTKLWHTFPEEKIRAGHQIIIGITLASITIFSSLFIVQPVKSSSIHITGIHTDKGYAYHDESTHKTNMLSGGITD